MKMLFSPCILEKCIRAAREKRPSIRKVTPVESTLKVDYIVFKNTR